ncbi:MAG: NADH:flavin oxidoreductase [Chlorobium phaeobacteroides]|uniref:NADH:flavin oxidoreductase/NADH oxidase n=1 Tax=Chlorobium phaeobacteroides (strain BS1) TaxID=331678 RepID=B3EQ30_CHLPB|nr:NADH:flavin oxidoreductase [Chlorobium phaeobacteroides]
MTRPLFVPANIAGITLQNRIIRSATHESMADEAGAPTEALEKLYVKVAKGGAGAIITGYAGIQQDGKSSLLNMLMINRDELIPSYRKLTDTVHEHDVPVILQIAHCGRQTRSAVTGLRTVAPSPLKDFIFNEETPHALEEHEIETIIDNFVTAAERAKKAGFDGIQLHLAHGYLLAQFLSGYTNRRKDRWGGSTENRFRIVSEIMDRIRKRQDNFPVLAKINAYDSRPGGMRIEEAVKISRLLESSGCDAIEVSSGVVEEGLSIMRGPEPPVKALFQSSFRFSTMPAMLKKLSAPFITFAMRSPKPYRAYNLEAANAIKQAVSIPVITVGGLHELTNIASALESGSTDFISMSRPFIIEPDIVRKFSEGKQTTSRCIMCNYCALMIESGNVTCYYGKLPACSENKSR